MKTPAAARAFPAVHVLLPLLILAGAGRAAAAPTVTVDGAALLDEALADATLSVEAPDGTVLVADAGRTNWAGRFTIEIPESAAGYRIVARGGHTSRGDFDGTLAARLDAAAAPQFVVLEPITALVDAYRRAEPSATREDAYARVEAFLGIPADPGIAAVAWDDALGVSSPYFDRSLFMERAGGGFDTYVAALVQDVRDGGTRRFVRPSKRPLLRGVEDVASDLAKDLAGKLGGMALDALLEKTGLLDKLGLAPEKVNVATREQVEELARSIEAVRADLKRVSDQIATSTEPIANQVAELREFVAFTTRNQPISDHLTVFTTVRGDYTDFITGDVTSIAPSSLIASDINTRILGAGNDFRDRVNSIHGHIVPTDSVGELVDGVYTLLAKVARENGKEWSVVENYFVKLTGWQTQAIGLYLDAKRYKKAPQGDIDAVKAKFRQQLAAQRLALLRAAEVFVLHKGPRGLKGVPATDLAPMRRADHIVHYLEGKKGWVTAAVLGFSDPVVGGLASYAGPYMQVDAASMKHEFDDTYGSAGNSYYKRNVEYPLSDQNCYYYVGRDFAERNSPGYFEKLVAGLGCKARVMRHLASLEPPPFLVEFTIASSAIEDADAVARRAGQLAGDYAPPFGTLTFSKLDLVTGADSTVSDMEQVSLAGSVNATASATSQFALVGQPSATLILIPGNAITDQGVYLAAKCDGGGTVRFGFGTAMAGSERAAFPFRQVKRQTAPCTGPCPAPEVAFGFKCPGASQERFLAPPATEGGLATASALPVYFKLAAGTPRDQTRFTYTTQDGKTAALYLNIPTTIGFYAGLVGYDLVGKSKDVGAFRNGTRLQTGGGFLEKRGYGHFSQTSFGEKKLSVRILGERTLDFDLSATGAVAGTLVREVPNAKYAETCGRLQPSVSGSFSADDSVFATRTTKASGSCSGPSPVSETFTGTASVKAKAPKSTLSVTMRAVSALSSEASSNEREWYMRVADGNLSATNLQVTIANPGNF